MTKRNEARELIRQIVEAHEKLGALKDQVERIDRRDEGISTTFAIGMAYARLSAARDLAWQAAVALGDEWDAEVTR